MLLEPENLRTMLEIVVLSGTATYTSWRYVVKPLIARAKLFSDRIDSALILVEHELRPNSGGSIHDKITSIARATSRVEDRLTVNVAMSRSFAADSTKGWFEATPDGKFLWVNDVWSKLTGITSREAFDQGWVTAVHEDDRDHLLEAWKSAIEHGRTFIYMHRYRHVESDTITRVRVEANPIHNERRVLVGWTGCIEIVEDVS